MGLTASTEQERAEFQEWALSKWPLMDVRTRSQDGNYADFETRTRFMAWQEAAARRAPAVLVPQGWKLVPVELLERIQESLGSFVSDQGWSQSDMDTADALDGLRAAAPQPPEAAPVQLPEPAAWRYTDARGHYRYRGMRHGFAAEYPLLKPVALYTEQQVRELLANHGIQERST